MEKGGEAKIDLKRDGIEDLSGRVHLLPCCIKHDGPTEVSQYFKPKPTGVVGEDGLPLQQSHFRGRLLEGTTLPLPHNYSGFVLGKKNSVESSNSWETSATFNDITYWNHDSVPSNNDDFSRAFHWIPVAEAGIGIYPNLVECNVCSHYVNVDELHTPVTPEELESSSITL